MSWSNPGDELVETGICPDSLFSDISNKKRFERWPIVDGISPVKLFEFRALQENKQQQTSLLVPNKLG
jgi:hypothetical protein